MASKEAENILKQQMPGVRIVPTPAADPVSLREKTPPPAGPSLAQIRAKYAVQSGTVDSKNRVDSENADAIPDLDDIEVVRVEHIGPNSDANGPLVQTIIISRKLGTIIGKQG